MAASSHDISKDVKFLDQVAYIDFTDEKNFHDRVIVVDGKKFYVQAGVLSMSSEYFRGLFSEGFVEKDRKEFTLEDVSAFSFEFFLKTIYPIHLSEPINWFEVTETSFLLESMGLSHRFLSPCSHQEVKKAILHEIQCYGLSRVNFVEFIEMVLTFNLEEFKVFIFDSMSDPVFSAAKKEEMMNAPESIKNFVFSAYMDGKIETIKSGGFGGFASDEPVEAFHDDDDW